jgi:hypothetical protein
MTAPRRPSEDDRPPASRRDTLRHLLNRHQLRESLLLAPQSVWSNSALAGLQAGLVVLIALPLVHLSPWPAMIGYGALGALVTLFGRFAPKARRSGILIQCALWQVLAVLSMSLGHWRLGWACRCWHGCCCCH